MLTLALGCHSKENKILREIGNIITWVSMTLLAVGYVWSFIISWRKNKWLFVAVLFIWIFGYPILLAKYWAETKNNFFVILAGIACFILSFIILATTNPNRIDITAIECYSDSSQQVVVYNQSIRRTTSLCSLLTVT